MLVGRFNKVVTLDRLPGDGSIIGSCDYAPVIFKATPLNQQIPFHHDIKPLELQLHDIYNVRLLFPCKADCLSVLQVTLSCLFITMPEQRKEPLNAPAPRRSARLNADESRMATGLPGMQKVELSGNISVEGHRSVGTTQIDSPDIGTDPVKSRQKGRSDPRRARNDEGPRNNLYGDPSINAMKHLSSAERDSWKGWCEIESEPVSNALYTYVVEHPTNVTKHNILRMAPRFIASFR